METLKPNINDIYKDQLNEFVKKNEYVLHKFINYQDKATFVLDEEEKTFYFSPKEKKIGIPFDRFLLYLESLNDDAGHNNQSLKARIGMSHEMSHFRDMLKEKQIIGSSSMYKVLKSLSGKKIQISDKEYIPIGEMIHTFYNCMDDIIVNWEVIRFKDFMLSKEDFHDNYQKDNFADYIIKDGGSFVQNPKGGFMYVGEGKGTHELNTEQEVNYSKIPMYKAISYYFLRKEMVNGQKIKLPERLGKILFYPGSQKNLSWRKSLGETQKLLDQEISKAEISSDPKILARYHTIKTNMMFQKQKLALMTQESTNSNSPINKIIKSIFEKISGKYDITQFSPFTISLEQIIQTLSISQGKEADHALCIMPSLRYDIYNQIFEPIIETFILIDLLYNDPKDMDPNDGKKKGKKKGNNDGDNDGDKDGDKNGDNDGDKDGDKNGDKNIKNNLPISGKGTYHRSIEDQLKTLEEIDAYQKSKEAKDRLEKEKKEKALQISSIIDDYNLNRDDYNLTKKVETNFSVYTQNITDILYKELEILDFSQISEKQPSKKGKINYDGFIKELPSSILDGDFSNKTIYERSEIVKKLQEEFKKVLFYFVIDISGSTDGFKGENGIMNGIITSLTIAWKNVEKKIQTLLKDPNYTIPIKFIIYTDSVVYFTKSTIEKQKNEPYELELIRVNSTINSISGGTNDLQGWNMVTKKIEEDLSTNSQYIQDIQKGDMKPIVLQIADSDVTDEGVNILRDKITQTFGKTINERLMTKRIILGQKIDKEYSEDELEQSGRLDWKDSYLKDGRGQVVIKNGKKVIEVKEVGIRSKKDIINQIENIFKNFFADLIKKK